MFAPNSSINLLGELGELGEFGELGELGTDRQFKL